MMHCEGKRFIWKSKSKWFIVFASKLMNEIFSSNIFQKVVTPSVWNSIQDLITTLHCFVCETFPKIEKPYSTLSSVH